MLPQDVPGSGTLGSPTSRAGDWVLAGVVAAVSVAEVLLRDDMAWRLPALTTGLLLASTMLFRRTHPLAAVVVASGSFVLLNATYLVVTGAPFSLYAGGFILVLVHSLIRWADTLGATIGMGVVALLWGAAVATDASTVEEAVGGALVLLLAAALGLAMRYRSVIWAQKVEHIRSQERESLARELHDTVAHHVSGIAIQAQAGRVMASSGNTDGALRTLETIEQEASRTLAEMRSMVRALRRHAVAPDPSVPHGVDDIMALATPAGATMRPVIEVEQHGDFDTVGPTILMALHRVAREAVTNARRHGRPALVHVLLNGRGRAASWTRSVRTTGCRSSSGPTRPDW